MVLTVVVHAVVQAAVSRFQHQPHALVSALIFARSHCIQVSHAALDLLQDGQRVGRGDEG